MAASAPALAELLRRAAGHRRLTGPDRAEAARQVSEDPVTEAFQRVGVELSAGAGQRLDLFRRAAVLCPAVELEVAGYQVTAGMTDVELWRFYLPICQALSSLRQRLDRRVLLGVAGAGASGKSVFAALVREVFNKALSTGAMRAALCPMDGFHFANAYLDSHFVVDEKGKKGPLRAIKGAPQTFDVGSFVHCLRRLRDEPSVALPCYDRRLHDPVPEGIQIGPADRIAVVEGNYLLLDAGPWAEVARLLDLSLFILQPLEVVRDAMVKRHILGGRSKKDALRHFEQVDRSNFELCVSTASRADLVVRRDAAQRVVSIEAVRPGLGRGN